MNAASRFMVLMIQTGVPSAQTALALLVAAGLQKQAGQMSRWAHVPESGFYWLDIPVALITYGFEVFGSRRYGLQEAAGLHSS